MRLKAIAEKFRNDTFFKDICNKQLYEQYMLLYNNEKFDVIGYIASILFNTSIEKLTKKQIYATKRCLLKNLILHLDDVL